LVPPSGLSSMPSLGNTSLSSRLTQFSVSRPHSPTAGLLHSTRARIPGTPQAAYLLGWLPGIVLVFGHLSMWPFNTYFPLCLSRAGNKTPSSYWHCKTDIVLITR
jgi:hypothetical protein